jgi:sec-independent protein translocase protein TatA
MLQNLTGWHAVVILVIVLLLFGAPKLPGLAKSLGQSMKIFKSEIKSDKTDDTSKAAPTSEEPTDPTTKP